MTATQEPAPRLLLTDQAAAFLAIGRRTLQEQVEAKEIAVVRIGRSVRFDIRDLEAFVERRKIKAKGWKGGAA